MIKNISVLGAGTMGHGIAHVFARHGYKVSLYELFDAIFLLTAVLVGLVFRGEILGIGIGTVIAVIFGGRVIVLLDSHFHEKLVRAAGMHFYFEEESAGT